MIVTTTPTVEGKTITEYHGVVTGEAIGQVSSQTLANLSAIDPVADRPVLRPLCGFDKDEIMAEATRIGLLSDIHANAVALRAVLDDMEPVNALVCAGDIVT